MVLRAERGGNEDDEAGDVAADNQDCGAAEMISAAAKGAGGGVGGAMVARCGCVKWVEAGLDRAMGSGSGCGRNNAAVAPLDAAPTAQRAVPTCCGQLVVRPGFRGLDSGWFF